MLRAMSSLHHHSNTSAPANRLPVMPSSAGHCHHHHGVQQTLHHHHHHHHRQAPQFDMKGLIQHNFHPQLSSELERLFLPDLVSVAMPLAMPLLDRDRHDSGSLGSAASSPGIDDVSPWDDFRNNGRDQDLDELDRLVRGMENNTAMVDPEPFDLGLPSLDLPLSGAGGASSTGSSDCLHYPPLSASPGSDTGSSGSSSDGGVLPPGCSSELLAKARLLELLRERERDILARRRQKVKGDKVCVFCRNNGESEAVYSTHQLKDAQGRVTCPVLYIYTCPICGASGENSHTIKYCPLNPQDRKAKNNAGSPRAVRSSTGKRK